MPNPTKPTAEPNIMADTFAALAKQFSEVEQLRLALTAKEAECKAMREREAAQAKMNGDDPYDWSEHWKSLAETHMRESDRYKALLFDAWNTIRGQAKGLKRQARRIKVLREKLLKAKGA